MSELDRFQHWDSVYRTREADAVSWFQAEPAVTLELVELLGDPHDAAIIDVGGGASRLVDRLLVADYSDVTVLDLSPAALAVSQARLGDTAGVEWIAEDLLTWQPARHYDLWHDRAVLHFLSGEDVTTYRELLEQSVTPGGCVILGTFAPDGPEQCSGLPVTRYGTAELTRFLAPTFVVVEERHELHTTPSGTSQSFAWVAARRLSH